MADVSGSIVVLITSSAEWDCLRKTIDVAEVHVFPFGEYFDFTIRSSQSYNQPVRFARIGWGKISSASGTQFVIDRWAPRLLINIGTCGGIAGRVEVGDTILVKETIVYDLHVEIGDPQAELDFYRVMIDLSWLPTELPSSRRIGTMMTGDRDLRPEDIAHLVRTFDATAADWESGAIAFVANRNEVPCLILRVVSDVVSESSGEAYGENQHLFSARLNTVFVELIGALPRWIEAVAGMLSDPSSKAVKRRSAISTG